MPKPDNDFRIAIAGMITTAAVAIWGSHLAYKSGVNQMHAETDRAATQFAKEQRKTAYVDYLAAEEDLHNTAFRLYLRFDDLCKGNIGLNDIDDSWNAWTDAGAKNLRTDSEVKLVASTPVAVLIKQWDDYDDGVSDQLVAVKNAVLQNNPKPAVDKLGGMVGNVHEPSLDIFVNVAKADLGLAKS
jgi:hypothetical protein